MTLPEWLLLGALRVLAPGSRQPAQQVAGTHVRTEKVFEEAGSWDRACKPVGSLGVSLA